MKKYIDFIRQIKINKLNTLYALLALCISSIIFVIPFIHCITLTNVFLVCLTTIGLGLIVFGTILLFIYLFSKMQTCIIDLNFSELLIQTAFVFSIELIAFSIATFLLMLSPLLFIALGIVIALILCGFNIYFVYRLYEDKTISKIDLLKSTKIANITFLSIAVILWLIV